MMVDYSYMVATGIGIFIGLLGKDIYTLTKDKLKYLRETVEIPIELRFKNVAENENELLELKYSILLVKYGKDEVVKEPEKLLNKGIMFKGYNPKVARIKVHKVLGAQFKYFADYKREDQFDKIKKFLEKNGSGRLHMTMINIKRDYGLYILIFLLVKR